MTKRINLVAALLVGLVFTAFAAAQGPSLASMAAGETFTSAKYGFSIALPAKPTHTDEAATAHDRTGAFTWRVREGLIDILFTEFLDGKMVNTPQERAAYLSGYKGVFVKDDAVSSLTEAPFTVGEFKGMSYSMLYQGNKARSSVIMSGNKVYTITAFAFADVPGSETLILKAANSFSLTAVK